MMILHPAPAPVQSVSAPSLIACPKQARFGRECSVLSDSLGDWCPSCRERYYEDRQNQNDWMSGIEGGRMASGFEGDAESIALMDSERPGLFRNAEPRDLAAWLDAEVARYRALRTDAGDLVAILLEKEAKEVRAQSATTAEDYLDRVAIAELEAISNVDELPW